MTVRSKGGFTLIEILVVLAIIGILASVILPRFSTARAKSVDANIKTNLSILTETGEIYFDDNDTYAGFCASADTLRSLEDAARRSSNNQNNYECNDSAAAWAAAVALQVPNQVNGSSGVDFWCVETRTSPRLSDATTTLNAGGFTCD